MSKLQKKLGSLGLYFKPNVLVHSERENINQEVGVLVDSESTSLSITPIDIEQSNSIFEMFFHRLKHRYLFAILLSNFGSLVKGTDFYLIASNSRIRHSAWEGGYSGRNYNGHQMEEKTTELKEKIAAARQLRMETKKTVHCAPCLA